MTSERIFIVGAGAVGKVLAVCLKLSGKDVILVRGSVDEPVSRKDELVIVLKDGSEWKAELEITSLSQWKTLEGLIVLTNKSFGNQKLSEVLKGKTGDSPLVLLQNGLGVERFFGSRDFPELFRCVLFMAGESASGNKVAYNPVAPSAVGIVRNNRRPLGAIVQLLDTPHFRFREEPDIQKVIWGKVIANCVFNSICPLLEIDNGIFHRDVNVFEMARRVIHECVQIANAYGIALSEKEIEEKVRQISKASDGKMISTWQDLRNKRPTEIDTLNLEIARIAGELKMEDAVQVTRLLGELIKAKSELY